MVCKLQDDEIDELEPFVLVAKLLKDLGAYKIYAMATHGTFPEEALPQLEQSPIDEVCTCHSCCVHLSMTTFCLSELHLTYCACALLCAWVGEDMGTKRLAVSFIQLCMFTCLLITCESNTCNHWLHAMVLNAYLLHEFYIRCMIMLFLLVVCFRTSVLRCEYACCILRNYILLLLACTLKQFYLSSLYAEH